jgi:hypothetical protein
VPEARLRVSKVWTASASFSSSDWGSGGPQGLRVAVLENENPPLAPQNL